MKSLIALLFSIGALTAQAQQAAPCLKLGNVKIAGGVLHKDGATQAELTLNATDCYVVIMTPDLGEQPPAVQVTADFGLTASVQSIGATQFDQTPARYYDIRVREITVKLNLTASREAALGIHMLPVRVDYKVGDGLGNVSIETLAFDVPVRIAGEKWVRAPSPPFAERHPVWIKVMVPLLIIIYIPFCLVRFLIGLGGCGS